LDQLKLIDPIVPKNKKLIDPIIKINLCCMMKNLYIRHNAFKDWYYIGYKRINQWEGKVNVMPWGCPRGQRCRLEREKKYYLRLRMHKLKVYKVEVNLLG
jgi:hypothetical protein